VIAAAPRELSRSGFVDAGRGSLQRGDGEARARLVARAAAGKQPDVAGAHRIGRHAGAIGEGRVGVLESIWSPDEEAPLTDRISDPVELLQAVAEGDADMPAETMNAVRTGTPLLKPYVKGTRFTNYPQVLSASCDFETFQGLYCGPGDAGYWGQFASEFVTNWSSTYPDIDCSHGNKFCESVAGTRIRTASANPAYLEGGSAPYSGACAAKQRVISCNGSTLFNTWTRESVDSGSWVPSLEDYWITENSSAVWIMYANGQPLTCAEGSDRDDMRYRTENEPGAFHNLSLFFIKWVDDTVACEPH
jgi:hypothetical protein